MKKTVQNTTWMALVALAVGSFVPQPAKALSVNLDHPDAFLCFRKLNSPNPYDLEVNLGSARTLSALPIGTTTNLSDYFYSTSQLTNAIGVSTFDDVKFSVFASANDNLTNYAPYALYTMWLTVPRTDPSTPSTPFARESTASLAQLASPINGIEVAAYNYSRARPASAMNTATAVEIPPGNTQSCEKNLGAGNFVGQSPVVIENLAPSPFDSSVISDFYVEVPQGYADPNNANATSGNISYLGYFTFSPDGSLTFTRANSTTTSPPPQPTLSLAAANGGVNISFQSTSGATYTLHFSSNLSSPVSSWATLGSSLTGDGTVKSFSDTLGGSAKFYAVVAH